MDRMDELVVLRAIAEAGSLARAARKLGRSAAGIDPRVGGARVPRRRPPRRAHDPSARIHRRRAAARRSRRALIADYEAAVHGEAAAPVRGLLRVTAPLQFGRRHMAAIVASFLDRYPEAQIELILNDRNLDLIDERLDAALRIGRPEDSNLVIRKVGAVRRVILASPAYLERRGEPLRPADLERHDTIFGALYSRATNGALALPSDRSSCASPRA